MTGNPELAGPALTAWPPPAPGAAPLPAVIATQAVLETRTTLRNGEQLLLTLFIPVLLLVAFTLEPLVKSEGRRVDFLVPGIIALAVMFTAFTSQAIATGFERRYGVLKRLAAHAPRAAARHPGRADRRQDPQRDRHRAHAAGDHHRGGAGPRLAPAWRPG